MTPSSRGRRQAGTSILEILVTLALLVLGIGGLFAVMGAAVRGASSAQRLTQGSARARKIIETIRPVPAEVLACLASTQATSWATCEAACRQKLGALASPQSCIFSSLDALRLDVDRVQQKYRVVLDPADDARSTWVRAAGVSGRVYDIQVTVGWNDDGTADPPARRVTLRTAVFR